MKMKKPTILLVLVLLFSLVPLSYSEPWIEIYTEKVKTLSSSFSKFLEKY